MLLYVSLHTQLDYYAEHQFFIHRLQHLVLHHLGPFLIVLSSPGTTLLAGMPGAEGISSGKWPRWELSSVWSAFYAIPLLPYPVQRAHRFLAAAFHPFHGDD